LTVDTAHLVKSGVEDVAGLIRDMAPVIDNFHMKDFADGEFKVLGQGRIDFAPIFAAVRQIGYSGVVSTDEESGAELKGAMLSCVRFMRDGLAQAKGVA
jgi:sugar phosphate isomerase/epimerase